MPESPWAPDFTRFVPICRETNQPRLLLRQPSRGDGLASRDHQKDAEDSAIKAVLAWQLTEAMRAQKLSKKKMAERLRTSRTQINRLLDPENDAVSLATLNRAARLVGKRIRLELVDAA
jgi:antitoxin HicB